MLLIILLNARWNAVSVTLNWGALSVITSSGMPQRATNWRNARRISVVVMSLTTSKCTARVTMHVKRETHTFVASGAFLTYTGPKKSIPVRENVRAGVIQDDGKGAMAGVEYGPALYLLQVRHCFVDFTVVLPGGIQNCWRTLARVFGTPACITSR